jgi:hypothetical protein
VIAVTFFYIVAPVVNTWAAATSPVPPNILPVLTVEVHTAQALPTRPDGDLRRSGRVSWLPFRATWSGSPIEPQAAWVRLSADHSSVVVPLKKATPTAR